jgi:hypothetical protein
MAKTLRRFGLAAILVTLSASALAAGRAEVSYADAAHFADAGIGPEIDRTQAVLTAHLNRLAAKLPDGQVLKVEVRDIDLAGEMDSLAFDRVRMLGRLPDGPRLTLSFEVRDGERVLASGQDVLSDQGYLYRSIGVRQGAPLEHERRLLDTWFGERVAPQVAAVR